MAIAKLGSGAPDFPREEAAARAVVAAAALGHVPISGGEQASRIPFGVGSGAGLASWAAGGGRRPSLGADAGDAQRGGK